MFKILIVDDEPDILEITNVLLSYEGYEVKGESNPRIVELVVEEFRPHLILMDIVLGKLDGRDLCNKFKGNALTQHIPIILFSAYIDMREDLNGCSADDFVSKPFDLYVLLQKIKKILAD